MAFTENIAKHMEIVHLYLILKVAVDFELVKLFCLVRTEKNLSFIPHYNTQTKYEPTEENFFNRKQIM